MATESATQQQPDAQWELWLSGGQDVPALARDAVTSTSDRLREPQGPGRAPTRMPAAPSDPAATPPPPVGPGKTADDLERNPTKPAESNLLGGYEAITELYKTGKADLDTRRAEARAQRKEAYEGSLSLSEREEAARKPILGAMKEWAESPLPEVPGRMAEPEQPDLSPRPFLEGPRKGGTVQQLNSVLQGLGMLATMAGGLSRGYAQGALAYYSGALTGWAEGDAVRADRDYRAYLLNLDKAKRDYQHRWDTYQAIVQQYGARGQQLQTQLLIAGAEFGEPRRRLELMSQNAEAALKDLAEEGKELNSIADRTLKIQDDMWKRYFEVKKLAVEERKAAVSETAEKRKAQSDAELNAILRGEPGSGSEGRGGGVGGPGGYDVGVSFGPEGKRVTLTPKKLGEVAQKDLRSYDSIIGTISEIKRTFTPDELEGFTGLLQRYGKDAQQFIGSLVPGVSDKRFALYKTLTARLQSSAFEVGGKQLTPFEYSVIEKITPTGTEMGGWTEYEAKMEGLEKFTRARKAATLHYAQRGLDPASVSNAEWDATMGAALQAQGINPRAAAPGPAAPGAGMRRALDSAGKPYQVPATTDLSQYPGWRWAQ